MIQSSPNGTATIGKPWAGHGHGLDFKWSGRHGADDGIRTRDPHLGKKREENSPPAPPRLLTWSSVRPFVRLVRPARPFRIPVYHRPGKRNRLPPPIVVSSDTTSERFADLSVAMIFAHQIPRSKHQ